jgi:hypothetical protein
MLVMTKREFYFIVALVGSTFSTLAYSAYRVTHPPIGDLHVNCELVDQMIVCRER